MPESFCHWCFNLYILSNESDLCHSARVTFPDNIKGGVNALSLSSSLTLLDDSSSSKMNTFNFWASVPLGVHSFIIYSFLLDPLVLETSRLDVYFQLYHLQLFSSMYKLTALGLSFRQSLNFLKLIYILVLIPVFPFFLM